MVLLQKSLRLEGFGLPLGSIRPPQESPEAREGGNHQQGHEES